jgi:hypothetical protein
MKSFVLLFSIFFFINYPLFANTITIGKIKGHRAIVDFTGNLKTGQVYELDTNGNAPAAPESVAQKPPEPQVQCPNPGAPPPQSREHLFAMTAAMSSLLASTSGSKTVTSIMFGGRYGWNYGDHEYGPQGSYSSYDDGAGTTTTSIAAGGFYDWNFTSNKDPLNSIFGFGITADIGNQNISSSSASTITVYPSGFMKVFFLGNTVAGRAELGYQVKEASVGNQTITYSGIDMRFGFVAYF